jgi:hypothetical protein
MKTYSIKELEAMNITKGELSKMMPDWVKGFDYALPQTWLDDISRKYNNLYYDLILSTTFWAYSDEKAGYKWGGPLTLCTQVKEMIEHYQGKME